MSFTRLKYKKVWTDSGDFPAYEGSEAQVREDMQYHPDAVKEFINEVLLAELEGTGGAAHIGDGQNGTIEASLAAIQEHLEANDQAIKDLASGESPEAVRATKVLFTADGWVEDSNTGMYELRILQTQHKRQNDAFGYSLRDSVDGSDRANSWQVLGTNVSYDGDTNDIVLTAESAYDGVIVFFGV